MDEYKFPLFLTLFFCHDVDEYKFPLFLTLSSCQDVDEYQFPLFLTSRQLIIMLDASLPAPHFFERNEDGSMRTPLQDAETAVYDLLDDVDEDMNDG